MPVVELARIKVRAGAGDRFEADFADAERIIASQKGFISSDLRRGVDDDAVYLLTVTWDRLEDHTEAFVGSDDFARFERLIGPHFDGPPTVEHFALEPLSARSNADAPGTDR